MKRKGHLEKLLKFLRKHEDENCPFTIKIAAKETGLSESSIRTYISKKLIRYLVHKDNREYKSIGVNGLSDDDFYEHMAQKSSEVVLSEEDAITRDLLKRSKGAYILAIEIYNRPLQKGKVEFFSILIINAWELLLKSEFIKRHGYDDLFYKKESKSLSLSDVLKRMYADNDPVRKNISYIQDVRDYSTHLLLPSIHRDISRLYQASIFNYAEKYNEYTGEHPLSGDYSGLVNLLIDKSENVEFKGAGIKNKSKVERFIDKFKKDEKSLDSERFAIPVEYKLILSKKAGKDDVVLSPSNNGSEAIIIEKPRDINKLYPYHQKEIIEKINSNISLTKLSSYVFQAILYKHSIKGQPKYHYMFIKPETHLYSDGLVNWIVENINKNPEWLLEAKESYSRRRK